MKNLIITIFCFFNFSTIFSQNWVLKNSNTTDNIADMYFKNETLGFYLTNTGKLYKTTDSGESWSFVYKDTALIGGEIVVSDDSLFWSALSNNGIPYCVKSSLTSLSFVKDTLSALVIQPEYWNNEIWSVEKVNQSIGIVNGVESYNISGNHISAANEVNIFYSSDFGNNWITNQFTNPTLNSAPYQSYYNGNDTMIAITNYPTSIYKSINNLSSG